MTDGWLEDAGSCWSSGVYFGGNGDLGTKGEAIEGEEDSAFCYSFSFLH